MVYYAKADGSAITEVAFPVVTPNGVGLSLDETTLYVAETEAARLWAFDIVEPGIVRKEKWPSPHGGRLVAGVGGYQPFDSGAWSRSTGQRRGCSSISTGEMASIAGHVDAGPRGGRRGCRWRSRS